MKADSLNRRLKELERQKRQSEPIKFVLRWAHDPEEPPEPGVTRIKLMWSDDAEKQYREKD